MFGLILIHNEKSTEALNDALNSISWYLLPGSNLYRCSDIKSLVMLKTAIKDFSVIKVYIFRIQDFSLVDM